MFLFKASLITLFLVVSCEEEEKPQVKIIGSERVYKWKHPHIVSLSFRHNATSKSVFCEGSILEKTWVLTSATCVDAFEPKGDTFSIEAGSSYSERQVIKVKKAHKHPSFKGYSKECIGDIALLELDEEIAYTDMVKPMGLPEADAIPEGDAFLVGWGLEDSDSAFTTEYIQLEAKIIPLEDCKKTYSFVSDKHICPTKQNKARCLALPGGPLKQLVVNTTSIIGVNCRGHIDCENKIEIFTRVSAYIDDFINPTINGH